MLERKGKFCKIITPVLDRLYVYDNSVDNEDARLLFRLTNGIMAKMYVTDVPEWARYILPGGEAIPL